MDGVVATLSKLKKDPIEESQNKEANKDRGPDKKWNDINVMLYLSNLYSLPLTKSIMRK